MTTRRSYTSAVEEEEHEPYIIVLDDQEFSATPWRMNPSQMIDIPGIAVHGDSKAMWEAFAAAFGATTEEPEPFEFKRFRTYVQAPGRKFEAETLAKILGDLIEAGTGRPTVRSAS
jgi:hypothetical protein